MSNPLHKATGWDDRCQIWSQHYNDLVWPSLLLGYFSFIDFTRLWFNNCFGTPKAWGSLGVALALNASREVGHGPEKGEKYAYL